MVRNFARYAGNDHFRRHLIIINSYIDGLVQERRNSNGMELSFLH